MAVAVVEVVKGVNDAEKSVVSVVFCSVIGAFLTSVDTTISIFESAFSLKPELDSTLRVLVIGMVGVPVVECAVGVLIK